MRGMEEEELRGRMREEKRRNTDSSLHRKGREQGLTTMTSRGIMIREMAEELQVHLRPQLRQGFQGGARRLHQGMQGRGREAGRQRDQCWDLNRGRRERGTGHR